MRARTIREGSVGLLILAGCAAFGGLILWLGSLRLGSRSYKFIVNFTEIAGMQVGAVVRYRGVEVGQIAAIKAKTNGVDATVEISNTSLSIPRESRVEANQYGLIGQTTIDITPETTLSTEVGSLNPLSSQCQESKLIICDKTAFREILRRFEER
ncbi:MAG: MCE family protein [Merismopedia sp. SIO2A8]|nr:MCE family protein [Merismopedia sp. SIO2A8]